MTREIAPAVPARKVSRAEVKPVVLTGKQPSAVSIALSPQSPVGSNANIFLGIISERNARYVRMKACFQSGKNFFMAF